jgi:hypothetical protein
MARGGKRWAGALLLFGGLVPPAVAQERMACAPDFSAVTSDAAAHRLVREGRLVAIRPFPGGPDDIGYLSPAAEAARRHFIGMLGRLVEQDLIDSLEVLPEYRGESIVPVRLRFRGDHSRGGGAPFEAVVEIW